jgi:acetyl-CoA carboxylase / biotin carboxylase 1
MGKLPRSFFGSPFSDCFWQVVVDPTINIDYMEMYADVDARGGVLEPEAIVNIKYRRDKQLDTMARLDPIYASLHAQLVDKNKSQSELSDVKVKMTEREQLLLPVYSQISLQFADLHDRAGRMKAKNVIRDSLRWRESRRFFYWRVRRRLNEEYIVKRISTASKEQTTDRARHLETLAAWTGIPDFQNADREVAMWYEENRKIVHEKVEALKSDGVAFDVATLLRSNGKGGLKGVQQFLSMLPVEEREEALKFLRST